MFNICIGGAELRGILSLLQVSPGKGTARIHSSSPESSNFSLVLFLNKIHFCKHKQTKNYVDDIFNRTNCYITKGFFLIFLTAILTFW